MESLLVKTLNSAQDNSTELQFMEKVYSDDGKWKFSTVLLKDGDFFVFRRHHS